jgi:ABC-type lipoprotein export system ATPase subunit
VSVAGQDLAPLDDDALTLLRRRHVGFVFQAFHVLPYLTVSQNVAVPLALLAHTGRESDERVAAMLDAVGLGDRGASMPRELSGGELQRVAIARALVHRPSIVLADEPTGNLDPSSAAGVIELLRDRIRGEGASGMLVTHSRAAAALADRALDAHERRSRGISMNTVARAVLGGALGPSSRPAGAVRAGDRARRCARFRRGAGECVGRRRVRRRDEDAVGRSRPRSARPARGVRRERLPARRARCGRRGRKPGVEVDARIEGRDEALRIYGVDAFRAGAITPALVPTARDALDVLRPGNVFVTPAAASWLGVDEGTLCACRPACRASPSRSQASPKRRPASATR